MTNFIDKKQFLISLANQLNLEGKREKAKLVDENFEEFLELLENGELQFDNTFFFGDRDPRMQRGNLGKEVTLSGISESQ